MEKPWGGKGLNESVVEKHFQENHNHNTYAQTIQHLKEVQREAGMFDLWNVAKLSKKIDQTNKHTGSIWAKVFN